MYHNLTCYIPYPRTDPNYKALVLATKNRIAFNVLSRKRLFKTWQSTVLERNTNIKEKRNGN